MSTETTKPAGSSRRLASLPIWLWLAAILFSAFAIGLGQLREQSAGEGVLAAAATLATLAAFVAFGIVGALVVSRQPRNVVGWLLIIEGSLVFVWPLDLYYNGLSQAPADPSPLFMLGLWFWGWLWLWLIFPLLFIPPFFPTGKLLSPRWRWVIALGLGLCVFFILFLTFMKDWTAQDGSWSAANPIGFLNAEFPLLPWVVLLLSFVGLSVASLFVRFRRAGKVQREQIKWLMYAAGLFFVIYATTFVTSDAEGPLGDLGGVLLFLGILTFPVAIGIAILRYRLYDIDIIIRKTLVYAVLTVLLALVYFGSVVLMQQVLGRAGLAVLPRTASPIDRYPLAIVVSTLIIAALFTPLRRRIQEGIDRRFFRRKYDAQQVLAQFALTARDETDLDALTAGLVRVVQETMQPERVSVWLRPVERINLP